MAIEIPYSTTYFQWEEPLAWSQPCQIWLLHIPWLGYPTERDLLGSFSWDHGTGIFFMGSWDRDLFHGIMGQGYFHGIMGQGSFSWDHGTGIFFMPFNVSVWGTPDYLRNITIIRNSFTCKLWHDEKLHKLVNVKPLNSFKGGSLMKFVVHIYTRWCTFKYATT